MLLDALKTRLLALVGPQGLVAHSGQDSYLLWMPVRAASVEEAYGSWRQLSRQLIPAVTVLHASVPIQPCSGVAALAMTAPVDADVLTGQAELACSVASRLQQTEPVVFSEKLGVDAERREQLRSDMAESLAKGGFELRYQPLVATNGAALHKAEALLRWQHPRWGVVAPGVFIPVAEQSDLIIEITDWVLHTAAKQVKYWRETLDATFQISVNIPPAYLNLCVRETEEMLRRLQALELPKGALVLEITEGAMLEVTNELLRVIDELRNLGFELALDDFGVGYSNFGQLDKLKLDHLKLDKTFIQAMDERPERSAICRAVVSMAHELGFKVVAEGIETEHQLEILSQMGVEYLQGYLWSKPMAAAAFETWATRQT